MEQLTEFQVDDASTAAWTGLDWFKVSEEGLDTKTGLWGVDSLLAGNGWWNFTMPACIAAGQYLMRVELIGIDPSPILLLADPFSHQTLIIPKALHSAYGTNGAQFYMS